MGIGVIDEVTINEHEEQFYDEWAAQKLLDCGWNV